MRPPGIDGACGPVNRDPIVCSVSDSGDVVACASGNSVAREGSLEGCCCVSTGCDMCALGDPSVLVSRVGTLVGGPDATDVGTTFMLGAVPSILASNAETGVATLVLYNFTFDNGTKPPVCGGPKSFDSKEDDTEVASG